MPVVLITGCSSGIGHHAALALASRGWTVVGTVRRPQDGATLEAAGVDVALLDVRTAEACQAVVAGLVERHGRLDAVVANAGHGLVGCFEDLDDQQIRDLFDVNLFGAMNTVRAALPSLRASRGRVVLISSVAGRRAAPGSGAYNASKYALEGWGESLRFELACFGVPVVLIEPGATTSGFARGRKRGARSGSGPYAAITARIEALQEELADDRAPVSVVVEPLVRVLEQRHPPLRVPTGSDTRLQLLASRLLPWPLYERIARRKLRLPRSG